MNTYLTFFSLGPHNTQINKVILRLIVQCSKSNKEFNTWLTAVIPLNYNVL